jgi:hypothetical protein
MKHLRLIALFLAYSLSPIANHLFAEQITMDLTTATDLNGNPITYSQSYGAGYYDLRHVWEQTYNDADSCRQILVNDGVFRLSHLPSEMSYGGMSWEGFTLSTVAQDTANVFGCVAKGGLTGVGTPYIIGYYSEWVSSSFGYSSNIVQFNEEYYPEYVYICQNSNTMEGITNGVFNARPFTGEDTLSLIIQALDTAMRPTATTIYHLAVNGEKNDCWIQVPLTSLGKTACLSFSMTTTDMGDWGANTPLYFAMDALTVNTEPLTALPNINNPLSTISHLKIIRDGLMLLLHNGELYTMDGRKVH